MQHDEVIWQVINQGFCSYKVKTPTANFCKNKYNVTGLCNRSSCPLANSRYATVLEEKGTVYLYIKTIERAHLPSKMWERIKLSSNYSQALSQITEQLQFWPNFNVHKCKQRLTKIHQYMIRMRKLKLKTRTKLVGAPKKVERREATREKKAEKAARLDDSITKELLQRLNAGTYSGSGMYLPPNIYEKVLDLAGTTEEIEDDEVEEEDEQEMELEEGEEYEDGEEDGEDDDDGEDDEDVSDSEFVADFGSDEEDDEATLEEIAEAFRGEPMDDGEDRFGAPGDDEEESRPAAAAAAGSSSKKRGSSASSSSEPPSKKSKKPTTPAKKGGKRVQRHVEVEYEQERESQR